MLPPHHLLTMMKNDGNAVESHRVMLRSMAFNGCILRPVRRLVRRIYAKPVRHRIFRLDTMWPWQKLIFCWPHLGTTLQVLWGRRIIPLGRPRCEACNRRDETCLVSKLADIWNFEQWLQLCTMVSCSCSCPPATLVSSAAFEYDRAGTVLTLAIQYSRSHVRKALHGESFHVLESSQVLIPSACLKTTLFTFSEYNHLLFIR